MSTVDPGVPPVPMALEPEPGPAAPRSPLHLVVGLLLVVLVVAAGVFAVVRLRSASDGGAGSPEDAVAALFEALGDEDLVGLADVLLPGERRAIADPVLELLDELRRLEVLADDFDASSVAGIDLGFDDLRFVAEPVWDDVVNVVVSGTIRGSADPREVPLGRRLLDLGGIRDELDGPGEPAETSFSGVRLTTVRHDGRWYVSLFHTLGEAARLERGRPAGDFPDGLVPYGSASPAAALEAVVAAVERVDVRSLLEMLDPDEAAALHRYAPLFLDDLVAATSGVPVDLEIELLGVEVDQRGDRAFVRVGGYRVHAAFDDPTDGPVTVELEVSDGCTRMRAELDGASVRPEEWGPMPFGTVESDGTVVICDDEMLDPTLDGFPLADLAAEGELVFTRHDGQWFLSPIATGTESLLGVLRQLDGDDLDALVRSWLGFAVASAVGATDGGVIELDAQR